MSVNFSIIIPVYNRGSLLPRTLDSIFAQKTDGGRVELIIADNGSTDDTVAAARRWIGENVRPDFFVKLLSCPERGAPRARNAGFKEAQGEIVLFFDSDDELPPGALQAYAEAFESPERPDIVIGTTLTDHPDGRTIRHAHRRGSMLLNQLNHSILTTPSFAARKELLLGLARDNGGELWNPELRIWQDWELGMRILLASPAAKRIDRCVALIHAHEASITGGHFSDRPYEYYERSIAAAEKSVIRSDSAEKGRLMRWFLYRRMMLAGLFAAESRALFRRDLITADEAERLQAESAVLRRTVLQMADEEPYREFRTPALKPALRFAYAWVRRGLRGCASVIAPLI